MKIVVDANIIIATVIELPFSTQVSNKLTEWKQSDVDLLAPYLLVYEISSALQKAITTNLINTEIALESLESIGKLRIKYSRVTSDLHRRVFYWAEKLNQSKSYDAQYIALAEREGVEFWTADRRLANNAQQIGVHWVQLITADI